MSQLANNRYAKALCTRDFRLHTLKPAKVRPSVVKWDSLAYDPSVVSFISQEKRVHLEAAFRSLQIGTAFVTPR